MIEIILIISILAGQLIKFPLFGIQGPMLLDVSVILLSIIGIYQTRFKFKKPSVPIKIGFLFILVSMLSLVFTPLHLTLNEYLISSSYTLRFTLYLLFAYLIYCGAFVNFDKKIPQTLLFSGVGLSILGLLQFFIFPNLEFLQVYRWDPHYFRTVSSFLDPNFAGAYFVLTLLLFMSLRIRKGWQFFLFSLVYLALLTTFSRSSYLMFLTSGLVYALLQKSKKTFILIVVLFLSLLLGFQIYSQLIAQPRGIDREQSASYRINTWQDGITIFQKSPLMGVGFNAYKYAIRQYHLTDQQFLESRGSSTNDSSFLYILSTTGIVGFIVYLLFLISILKISVKQNKVLAAAIIGLILHSFFANSFFYPFILIWILLFIV